MPTKKSAKAKGKKKKDSESKGPGGKKNYYFTPEADILLGRLKKKLNINRTTAVSEAVVDYAKAKGIVLEGKKNLPTTESLAKKIKKLQGVVNALCEIALDDHKCTAKVTERVDDLIQDAVNDGTRRNVQALWNELEDALPQKMQDEDLFKVYVHRYPIPKKSK